jgi:nucleoside-diphosphate-sugar epimerase
MDVLISGADGLIGGALRRRLCGDHRVLALTRRGDHVAG